MCLVKENGSAFDVAIPPVSFAKAYSPFEAWLKDSRAVSMGYMLSAQLAACSLDAAYMGLDTSYKLLLPSDLELCIDPQWNGPFTIQQILDMAKAELCAHPTAGPEDAWRSYQGCLKTIIDGVNNNRWLFISKEKCCPVYPEVQ
jgi:hypothetical protein